ncbi:hypothetical protein C8F01DRAFT_1082875 [Mycena amicta]|nr:hypothetical protein C8F01DRAFT_1082875 [Mycena amicta]
MGRQGFHRPPGVFAAAEDGGSAYRLALAEPANGNTTVKAANDKQMAERKLALRAPLRTGLQFTLALEIPPQNPAPNARKLPRIPSPGSTVVQLCDELQHGIDGFSQVWTAECIDDPGTCLALKIIQPSICRSIPEHPIDEYYDPWDLAHNEAWVYQHLPHYQGLLIPYFFGLSTEAWVLVLEFIPGLTVYDILNSASISNIRDFCTLGSNAVREFVQGGWTLHDIRSPNFILTGSPGTSAVVIIDLFLCEPRPTETTADTEYIVDFHLREFFFKFLLDASMVDKGICGWTEKNIPSFLASFNRFLPSGNEDNDSDSESDGSASSW